MWESRVSEAHEAGRKAGIAEAQQRITDAERRAKDAEQNAAKAMEAKQKDFLARFEPILSSLSTAVGRLDSLEKQVVAESEAEAVRLALAIAAAVLRETVERDPKWMDALVKRALLEVPDRRQVVVRMHPQDACHLRDRITEVGARIPGLEKVDVIDDGTLARGSCILLSQGTRLDTSLAGCWERLATKLLDAAPSSDCVVLARPGDNQSKTPAPKPAPASPAATPPAPASPAASKPVLPPANPSAKPPPTANP
jgi:flagellar biosynthesis/type III secretory pathway protein FliH